MLFSDDIGTVVTRADVSENPVYETGFSFDRKQDVYPSYPRNRLLSQVWEDRYITDVAGLLIQIRSLLIAEGRFEILCKLKIPQTVAHGESWLQIV